MKRHRVSGTSSPNKSLSLLALSLPLLLATGIHQGCGSSDSSGGGPKTGAGAETGTGTGANGGNGTGAGGTGTGASGAGGGNGGNGAADAGFDADFAYDAPAYDSGFDPDAACAGESVAATPVPLDLYLMLDKTGSMGADCSVTWPNPPSQSSKWCYAVNAIAGYLNDPSTAGNRAAIQFFSGGGGAQCNGTGLNVAAAGLVDLPAQANVIVAAMDGTGPGGNTPTEGALNGLAQYTASIQSPGRITIGILITDGDPTSCNLNDGVLAAIPAAHFAATGIHTFMIGMTGGTFSRLETWASYPGAIAHDDTNDACGPGVAVPCHSYNVGNGDPAVFTWALQQIQNSVLGCTYNVPQPQDGGVLDPALVVVEYQPGGQPPGQQLTKVADAASCVPNGWYYDDNANPTTISLCADMCTTVQADSNAKVNILLGCQGS